MDITEAGKSLKIFAAPLQGYTDGIWRKAHAEIYGSPDGVPDAYFSPFVRVEKGGVRPRDLRDLAVSAASKVPTIPQIIFKDADEFKFLVETLAGEGFTTIDLNLGCPFPPQCHKGRGAAMVERPDSLVKIADEICKMPEMRFSAKMRLGVASDAGWKDSVDIINDVPLTHLTVHPRIASQQYKGELHLDAFAELLAATTHRVIFNGDITAPESISEIYSRFPSLTGVMLGRGLLGRPSIIAEWRQGELWPLHRQTEAIAAMHRIIFDHYRSTLCGESQILSKIIPFWDYLAETIGAKAAKSIKKAKNLAAYEKAVAETMG